MDGVGILQHRLGKINVQGVAYGEVITINGVHISFHPAGHVLGSAQIKLQNEKESWVISGDYKLEADGVSAPFEPVICDHFVTESTFGLPIFQWDNPQTIFDEMMRWWQGNAAESRPSVIAAYSLGKAQRVLNNLLPGPGPIITHNAVEKINEVTRAAGIALPQTYSIDAVSSEDLKKSLIICPPMAVDSKWSSPAKNARVAVASGWMALRGTRRRRNISKGFVLSDHADWKGLNTAVKQTQAEHIYVTHGYTHIYTRYLNEQGYTAAVVETEYEGESLELQEKSTV